MSTPGGEGDALAGPYGSLALGAVLPRAPDAIERALVWAQRLAAVGLHPPLVVVHDLGWVLASAPSDRPLAPRTAPEIARTWPAPFQRAWDSHQALVRDLSALGPFGGGLSPASLDDRHHDAIAAVLARILAPLAPALGVPPPAALPQPAPRDAPLQAVERPLPSLLPSLPSEHDLTALEAIARGRLRILCVAAALGSTILRLTNLLGTSPTSAEAPTTARDYQAAASFVDLATALAHPQAIEASRLALELLAFARENAPMSRGSSRAGEGFEGLSRRGQLDALVATELAWDDDELSRRVADGEALYYTREEVPDEALPLHTIVIDATASMRGARAPFARAFALALASALHARGSDVSFRFFDGRLHEERRASRRALSSLPAAYVLAFSGERGRHARAVFEGLAEAARRLRAREGRSLVVHLITHAALEPPRPVVEALTREAPLFVTFLATRRDDGTRDPGFVDLTSGHARIDVDAPSPREGARVVSLHHHVASDPRASPPAGAPPRARVVQRARFRPRPRVGPT